jgi:uncharacterized protein YndB with AHSA1/START domain
VPKVKRARTIRAASQELWDVIADPVQFPRWWPDVVRVEDATPLAWTKVLTTPKGATVRADFTRLAADEPHLIRWRQELDESPFERIMSENVMEIRLEPGAEASTRVEMRAVQRLCGYSRFGGFLFRRAMRGKLEQALDGLERVSGS